MIFLEIARKNPVSYFGLQILLTIFVILSIVIYKEYVVGFSTVTLDNLKVLSIISIAFFVIQLMLLISILNGLNNPLVYFSIILYLFSSGQTFLLVLNLDFANYNVFERINNNLIVSDSIIFYSISYVFFHFGVLTYVFTKDKVRSYNLLNNINFDDDNFLKTLQLTGFILVLIGIVPFLTTLYNNINVFINYGYSGYYKMDDVRVSNLFGGFLYYVYTGVVFLVLSSSRNIKKILILLMILFSVIKFLLGDRGDGIVFALGSYLLYLNFVQLDKEKKKVKNFFTVFILSMFLMTLIPIVSIYRHGNMTSSLFINILINENPIISTLQNLGSTLYPLAKTMEIVNNFQDPIYGSSYLTAFLLLIPSIFRVGIISDITSNLINYSPANWLMETMNMSYGPGFTPFAEAYLNFGWYGIVFMILYGYFMGKMLMITVSENRKKSVKTNFFTGLNILCFLFFAMSSRGSFNFIISYYFRYIIVPILILYLLYIYAKRKGKR